MTLPLATIDMPQAEATKRLAAYRAQLQTERTAQDDRIRAAYRALARGLTVIKLGESLARGGWFDYGLPKVAVVRADATECWVEWEYSGHLIFAATSEAAAFNNRGALVNSTTVRVAATRPSPGSTRHRYRGRTIVPLIPPEHRPNRNRLHRFHLLWEVEEWETVPPRDPALLRWIGGDLWAVMATWDLTDIERAILGGA